MTRRFCIGAIILWVITLAIAGWFFVEGWTVKGSDGRTAILLSPAERDQVLSEMRLLLKAVDGVTRELGEAEPDLKRNSRL